MNKIKIKICGLTNEQNIRDVLELKPDMIGFIFYPPSPRFVEGKISAGQIAGLHTDFLKTGVFVNEPVRKIFQAVENYQLDFVQMHGEEDPEDCLYFQQLGIGVIKAFNIGRSFDFKLCEPYIPFCKYFLFDTGSASRGGSGTKFEWDLLKNYHLGHPFFLSGGIGPEDVSTIRLLNYPDLVGLDLNSRFELAPGLKDIDKLNVFIQEIRR